MSVCDYAEACEVEIEDCTATYAQIECKSDATASECASRFSRAPCGSPPKDCDIDAVADTQPAIAGCMQYLEQICNSATVCKVAPDRLTCLADAEVDCTQAVALGRTFEACLSEIVDIDCSAWVLPSACRGVVTIK